MTKRVVTLALLASLALAACGGDSTSEPKVKNGKPTAASPAPRTKNAALPTTTVRSVTTLAPRSIPTTGPRATATTQPKTATTAPTRTTLPVATTRPTAAPTTLAPSAAPTTAIPVAPTTVAPTTVAATAPTVAANSCTAQGPCKVGQTGPAGGIVFYAATTPQPWGQYMEVRPEAFEQIIADTCNLSAYDSYATGKLGDGLTQTNAVIAACAKDGKPAAAGSYARVDAYKQNGFDDWFIPSKDELQQLVNSNVVTFATDKDLTSGTWAMKPADAANRGFDVVWGVKKEIIAGTSANSRGGTVRNVEIMSDGSQSYGNPNNRWGWIYIARAFGPKA